MRLVPDKDPHSLKFRRAQLLILLGFDLLERNKRHGGKQYLHPLSRDFSLSAASGCSFRVQGLGEPRSSSCRLIAASPTALFKCSEVERLQRVFEKLGKQPSGTQCPAIDGIIKEADETAGEIEDKAVLDAAIVANAQAVEHYEMCRYGTLIAWAEELGHDEIVRFLTTNLNEEKAANTKLNTVALRKGVNAKASTAA